MRNLTLIAALMLTAAAAHADDATTADANDRPPPLTMETIVLQSTLHVLGYYDGPYNAVMDEATQAALDGFIADTGFSGEQEELYPAMLEHLRPALVAQFGIDPTGRWDLDMAGFSPDEQAQILDAFRQDTIETCASPFAITFEGMIYTDAIFGIPFVHVLHDGELTLVPELSDPDTYLAGFTVVDDNTMQRNAGGETETWRRCD